MKKLIVLSIALFALALPAFAQSTNFSGKWILDLSQSKLDERSRIESMTVTIEHKGESFVRNTERKDAPRPDGRPGMGGRGGAFALGVGREELTLNGKEKKSQMDTPMGAAPVSTVAKMNDDGTITVSTSRTFTTQMGEMTVTTVETFSISSDGSTLKIVSEMQGPRPSKSELVFKKS